MAQDKVTFALQSMNPNPLPGGTGDPIAHSDIESWLGTWTGPIVQKDSRPYSVELELVHDGTTVVGLVSYPDPN
ncbi:hypothetical protein [Williamsia sp.]|uniref:hypothetical protein n=1 Tax=Williamsia sp. TaxID=1872085 RepID=UPI002F93CB7B